MPGSSTAAFHWRLSEQLQALSQVGETLTLRLLELEERLAGLEEQCSALEDGAHVQNGGGESAELLAATEERIAKLEALLGDSNSKRASVVPMPRQPELEINPFPEEDGEQPFMDELSA